MAKNKNKSKIKSGPLKNKQGIAYDYIVIIDAGSKGSRVYVYQWLNPSEALKQGVDLRHPHIKLVREDQVDINSYKLPKIDSDKKWNTKIKPGISTFDQSTQKIGKHHLKYLLKLAETVVPKSQHARTPIFLHSTAGMRLLTPTEQQKILDSVCEYFTDKSNFFLPDCSSHINVIEGDIEGLYGWLASNYLMGSFDHPQDHQHGKNHTTYGLLDMGGASTQVVFQPNKTEISEHENNLYKLNLFGVPLKNVDNKFQEPESLQFSVYSDSFLGLGMSQAYEKYRKLLIANTTEESAGLFDYRPPIIDPCLPKGYTTSINVDDKNYDFTGDSNFELCLLELFPVLSKGSYGQSDKPSGNCQQYNQQADVSSCLLNDLIPAFDFDINYFLGVSGYWYATSKLMEYDNDDPKSVNKRDPKKVLEHTKLGSQLSEFAKSQEENSAYNYKVIYEKTSKLCSKTYTELIQLNNGKSEDDQLLMDELTNLCFKSSWILNFLHVGLGFPRFGIDEVKPKEKFKSLEFVDKINNKEFSWTLGRAILYANDEYIQAYNNISGRNEDNSNHDRRAGFTFSVTPGLYHYGSEQNGISPRPLYDGESVMDDNDDTEVDSDSYNELKWYIQPHRWYGIFIFSGLIMIMLWLMIGKQRRSRFKGLLKSRMTNLTSKVGYSRIRTDLEGEVENFELEAFPMTNSNDSIDQFKISDDEQEVNEQRV